MNSTNVKQIQRWAEKVDRKMDRIETVQRVEILTLFITMGTVLIKVFG